MSTNVYMSWINAEVAGHPSPEVIEQYVLDRLPDTDAFQVLDHLLVCEHCMNLCDEAAAFVMDLMMAFENGTCDDDLVASKKWQAAYSPPG